MIPDEIRAKYLETLNYFREGEKNGFFNRIREFEGDVTKLRGPEDYYVRLSCVLALANGATGLLDTLKTEGDLHKAVLKHQQEIDMLVAAMENFVLLLREYHPALLNHFLDMSLIGFGKFMSELLDVKPEGE